MLKTITLVLSIILISGCSSFEAKPLTATENSISLKYDPAFGSNIEKSAKKAKEHCAQYNKKAELKNTNSSTFGWETAIFDCK